MKFYLFPTQDKKLLAPLLPGLKLKPPGPRGRHSHVPHAPSATSPSSSLSLSLSYTQSEKRSSGVRALEVNASLTMTTAALARARLSAVGVSSPPCTARRRAGRESERANEREEDASREKEESAWVGEEWCWCIIWCIGFGWREDALEIYNVMGEVCLGSGVEMIR